jgi:hypothetical protein
MFTALRVVAPTVDAVTLLEGGEDHGGVRLDVIESELD